MDDSERSSAPVHGRQRVAQGLAPDSHFTLHGVRGRVYNDAKALAAMSVPFKIKKPHLHLPEVLGGCHLTGKHSAGADGADGMDSAAGATKDLHGAAATLQARFRGRRCLPSNAAGAAGALDVPKEKHGSAATLHASKLHVPRLHLRLPAALGGRRPASKRPVGASEGEDKAATRATLL